MQTEISESSKANSSPISPLFNLGFRPFFLVAGLFAIASIAIWTAIYFAKLNLPLEGISSMQWHAHEMIYGYSIAVIAGFLLTAVKNWTGVQTIYAAPLCCLVFLWLVARVLLSFGAVPAAAFFDLSFIVGLSVAVTQPIVKVKQWKQLAVLSKLFLLAAFNLCFYLGALGLLSNGITLGIYGGLYLIIGLILMIGRRVVPFFIERGVDEAVSLFNSVWLDRLSLAFFLVFFVAEVMLDQLLIAAYSSLGLFIINGARLIGWHTKGIWKKPLLWSLYLPLWFICLGFLLYALAYFFGLSKFIAVHAFAYGGIGAITLSMMSRVALGHTGRDIRNPPALMSVAFAALLLGAFVRIILPLAFSSHYLVWIGLSQALWIAAFGLFVLLYFPVLTGSRIDGRPG